MQGYDSNNTQLIAKSVMQLNMILTGLTTEIQQLNTNLSNLVYLDNMPTIVDKLELINTALNDYDRDGQTNLSVGNLLATKL